MKVLDRPNVASHFLQLCRRGFTPGTLAESPVTAFVVVR
jgi:hypothetical protein